MSILGSVCVRRYSHCVFINPEVRHPGPPQETRSWPTWAGMPKVACRHNCITRAKQNLPQLTGLSPLPPVHRRHQQQAGRAGELRV